MMRRAAEAKDSLAVLPCANRPCVHDAGYRGDALYPSCWSSLSLFLPGPACAAGLTAFCSLTICFYKRREGEFRLLSKHPLTAHYPPVWVLSGDSLLSASVPPLPAHLRGPSQVALKADKCTQSDADGKKANPSSRILILFLEIPAGQQRSGWTNTKISITQQCLPPETFLMESECHLSLSCHFARDPGGGWGSLCSAHTPRTILLPEVRTIAQASEQGPLLKAGQGPKAGGMWEVGQGRGDRSMDGPSSTVCLCPLPLSSFPDMM